MRAEWRPRKVALPRSGGNRLGLAIERFHGLAAFGKQLFRRRGRIFPRLLAEDDRGGRDSGAGYKGEKHAEQACFGSTNLLLV